MTLVKLEDVQNIISDWTEGYELQPMKDRINVLPTYQDPVQVLEEMIEELDITKIKNDPTIRAIWEIKKEALKLALARITKQ